MVIVTNVASFSAPAKINLFLKVTGKRSDGYHELETWMQKLDLCDVITLELATGTGIFCQCSDPFLPVDENNLAVRAAAAFCAVVPEAAHYSLHISLTKNIPVAAGLGGGSSDAGAVLRGLNEMFALPLSESELIGLARPLGADVPFFVLDAGAVIAEGIGDIMYPVDNIDNCFFVLVNPGFSVSTKWVYQNLPLTRRKKNSKLSRFQLLPAESWLASQLVNDLALVTETQYPEISDIKQSLREVGAIGTLMSGSGPTVFGVFPMTRSYTEEYCQRIVLHLQQRYGGKVYMTKTYTGV